jgi:hypothetical protein
VATRGGHDAPATTSSHAPQATTADADANLASDLGHGSAATTASDTGIARAGHGSAATTASDGGIADDGGDLGGAAEAAHTSAATTAAGGPVADAGDASASQISEEARKAGKQG